MPAIVTDTYAYLVGVQLHPIVTFITLMVIVLGRQRWEEVEADPIVRRKTGQNVLFFALLVSLLGQVSLYSPTSAHDAAICFFMAFGQVGVASFTYTYAEKWGLMERIGRMVQKKIDDKVAS